MDNYMSIPVKEQFSICIPVCSHVKIYDENLDIKWVVV